LAEIGKSWLILNSKLLEKKYFVWGLLWKKIRLVAEQRMLEEHYQPKENCSPVDLILLEKKSEVLQDKKARESIIVFDPGPRQASSSQDVEPN